MEAWAGGGGGGQKGVAEATEARRVRVFRGVVKCMVGVVDCGV